MRTRVDGDWVGVEIEDDGPEIPAEAQTRVFDPFFTTKPPREGPGLGLTVAHSIVVRKHKGGIELTSRPGKTDFQVRLPVAIPETPVHTTRAA